MKIVTYLRVFATVFFSLVMGISSFARAEALSYDRYAAIYKQEIKAPSLTKNAANHFLTAPFEIIKWPVDKSLIYIEKHYLDKKALWIYEKITDQGINPHLGLISVTSPTFGADVDFVRLLRQKDDLPDLTVKGWVDYSRDVIFETGTVIGWDHIAGTGLKVEGLFKYETRPQEHFYGIGPHSSAGDGSVYKMEATTLQSTVGYAFRPTFSTNFYVAYKNINVTGGKDGGRGELGTYRTFTPDRVPGIFGDPLLTFGVELNRDTRNHKDDSTSGGQQLARFSYNEGLRDSGAGYFKYEIEASKYLSLFSKRRVLVAHFYGEHNDEVNDNYVPFHQMATLGGYGLYPRLSKTLRAFDFNRFFDESAALFNLEYRYTIWENRDFKMDAVVFWDEGQVFSEFSKFQFKNFRESYGGGFRVSIANNMVLTVEVAHGDEGTNLYVKNRAPF